MTAIGRAQVHVGQPAPAQQATADASGRRQAATPAASSSASSAPSLSQIAPDLAQGAWQRGAPGDAQLVAHQAGRNLAVPTSTAAKLWNAVLNGAGADDELSLKVLSAAYQAGGSPDDLVARAVKVVKSTRGAVGEISLDQMAARSQVAGDPATIAALLHAGRFDVVVSLVEDSPWCSRELANNQTALSAFVAQDRFDVLQAMFAEPTAQGAMLANESVVQAFVQHGELRSLRTVALTGSMAARIDVARNPEALAAFVADGHMDVVTSFMAKPETRRALAANPAVMAAGKQVVDSLAADADAGVRAALAGNSRVMSGLPKNNSTTLMKTFAADPSIDVQNAVLRNPHVATLVQQDPRALDGVFGASNVHAWSAAASNPNLIAALLDASRADLVKSMAEYSTESADVLTRDDRTLQVIAESGHGAILEGLVEDGPPVVRQNVAASRSGVSSLAASKRGDLASNLMRDPHFGVLMAVAGNPYNVDFAMQSEGVSLLKEWCKEDSSPVRQAVAGNAKAVAALLDAGETKAVKALMADSNARVRRAALISVAAYAHLALS